MRTDIRTSWEAVYRAEGPRLWRALLLLSGNPEVASDAMAEAFAQGVARGDSVRAPGAWIWKAAFMIARGEMQRQGEQPLPDRLVNDPSNDEVVDVLRALSTLPPMQRASVVMHYYAGYSLSETASLLGSSRSAIGVHLFRARARLRRDLGDDYA